MAGDIPPGFWALAVTTKESFTITPPDNLVLRISGAALPAEANDKAKSSLLIKNTGSDDAFTVCTLSAAHPHTMLDLFIMSGQSITFSAKGNSAIHLTGYLSFAEGAEFSEDEDELGAESDDEEQRQLTKERMKSIMDQLKAEGALDDMDESEEEEEEEKVPAKAQAKAKAKAKAAAKAKAEAAGKQKAQPKKAAQPKAEAKQQQEMEEEDEGDSDSEGLAAAFGLSDDDEDDSEAEELASLAAKAQPKAQAKAKASAKAKAKSKEKAAPATPKQKGEAKEKATGQKRKEPEGRADAETPAKKAKTTATPKSGKPGTPGAVKCVDPNCKKTFPSEAAMQQHAKAKHGASS